MATLESLSRALNKVGKWRSLFVGWQLGTRSDTDPEAQAVRDHRDLSMLVRIDVNALLGLMIRKGVFTEQEWIDALEAEAKQYDQDLETRFPGAHTSDVGLRIDSAKALPWMSKFKP